MELNFIGSSLMNMDALMPLVCTRCRKQTFWKVRQTQTVSD